MSAHTPGPWHRDYAGMGNVWSKDCKVADVANPAQDLMYRDVSDEERGANAKLIAAAPDLLAALEAIVAMQKQHYGDGMRTHMAMIDLSEAARAAISLATGETTR